MKSRVFITGDTHGEIDYPKLLKLKKLNLSYNDYLIICGDCGICWSEDTFEYHKSLYNAIGCTILFVDGNHENFTMLNSFPLVEYLGALMHQIDKHIFHIMRGEILTINNKTFLCLGGAISIDKSIRVPYISYWPEEEITQRDIDNALFNLERFNNKVDYVITHCVDTRTIQSYFHYRRDICTDYLNFVDVACDYKHWFFGHYHEDVNIGSKRTCLYQDIIELKE